EEWGDRFPERLRGMFAVALWDTPRRRLLLARDRFGIKPLYVRETGTGLEFASELRALPRGEIDLDALEAFLAFNSVPAPLSIFQGTRKLPAGHILAWNGGLELQRFARPAPTAEVRTEDEAELVEELRARMRDSVRAHLVSDVPVGVLLSGGVDSCLLAALAAEETGELRLSRQALRPSRSSASARAPPRLEGDLLPRCTRSAHRTPLGFRSGRPAPRPLCRDGGCAAARAVAGRRPRDVSRRRPARED